MPQYLLSAGDMNALIENNVADEPIVDGDREVTYIEIFRFYRPLGEEDWIGPHHPRSLLDQILIVNDIEIEVIDSEDESKVEPSLDHLDIDALEEEARSEQSVNTRLNKFED